LLFRGKDTRFEAGKLVFEGGDALFEVLQLDGIEALDIGPGLSGSTRYRGLSATAFGLRSR